MGICTSAHATAEQAKSHQIDAALDGSHEKEKARVKLLLLGAGESGKSTIFKQMRILYGKGFDEAARVGFKATIFSNILQSMRVLLQQADDLGFTVEAAEAKTAVTELADDAPVDCKDIATLWADPGIKQTYDSRSSFQLNDSAAYYFNKIAEIGAPGYIPSVEDVLRSRVRTSGIVEELYNIGGVDFAIYDVGGQRNERKKWIHCFDAVQAVVFVASLSEYDQVLYEDHGVNRMVEAMELFSEIANSKWFEHSSIILFLNKRDLFEAKIKTVDLRHEGSEASPARFLDYTGGCNAKAAQKYILDKFIELRRGERPIYSHVTCATDTDNVRVVFGACKETILKENMKNSGFMT